MAPACRYVYKSNPARFARFARNVTGVTRIGSDEEIALLGIAAMEDFFREIGMPVSIGDMGITLTEEQIKELAYKCSFFDGRTIGGFVKLSKADMEAIYRMA